jgi:hypothetical protein
MLYTLLYSKFKSDSGGAPNNIAARNASIPNCFDIYSGATPFPFDLDIFSNVTMQLGSSF